MACSSSRRVAVLMSLLNLPSRHSWGSRGQNRAGILPSANTAAHPGSLVRSSQGSSTLLSKGEDLTRALAQTQPFLTTARPGTRILPGVAIFL